MDKSRSLYAIYKYDFHKAFERTIQAEADGVDGPKYLKQAQTCFASLFDQNSIDHLAKVNKKGEATRHGKVERPSGEVAPLSGNKYSIEKWLL